MNILLLNLRYLAPALERLGHRTAVMAWEERTDPDEWNLRALVKRAGFEPDLIVAMLMGYAPLPAGMADSPWPLAAVTLDAPINMFWLRHWLKLFDWVFVDQRDPARELAADGIPAQWLPLAVEPWIAQAEPARRKEHDITFVGCVDKERLKRKWLLRRLAKSRSLHVAGGQGEDRVSVPAMIDLFGRSRVVLNENFFPGVTLRVLQGMAAGALVLTEDLGGGLTDLFADGEHLAAFTPETLEGQVSRCLDDTAFRDGVARQARAEVLARHLTDHRAEALADHVELAPPGRAPRAARLAHAARACLNVSLRYPLHPDMLHAACEEHANAVLSQGGPDPDLGLALETLGRLRLAQNRLSEAQPLLVRAAQFLPQDPAPLFVLGRMAAMQGDEGKARRFMLAGLARCPLADGADLARALLKAGDLGPNLSRALARVARARGRSWEHGFAKPRDEECPDTAHEWLALAVRQHGGGPALLDLGRCALEAGLPDQAAILLAQAAESLPHDPEPALMAASAAHAAYNSALAELMRSRARACMTSRSARPLGKAAGA